MRRRRPRDMVESATLKYFRFKCKTKKNDNNVVFNIDYFIESFDNNEMSPLLDEQIASCLPDSVIYRVIDKKTIASLLLIDNIDYIRYNHIVDVKKITNAVGKLMKRSDLDCQLLADYYLNLYWERFGPDEGLLRDFKWYFDNFSGNIPLEIWLKYMMSLLELKKNDECIEILTNYVKNNGVAQIQNYLPLSKIALANGFVNDKIMRSAWLFENLVSSGEEVKKLLANCRVAVVGNGPNELGKHLGSVIDGYDHVIRFNYYVIKGYEEEYGTKTTIWVRNKDLQAEKRYSTIKNDNYKLILFETDIWRFRVEDQVVSNLCSYIEKGLLVTYIRGREIITHDLGIFPTSGLLLLNYLNYYFGDKADYNTFGFSDEDVAPYTHYYGSVKGDRFNTEHDLKKEFEYMKKNGLLRPYDVNSALNFFK